MNIYTYINILLRRNASATPLSSRFNTQSFKAIMLNCEVRCCYRSDVLFQVLRIYNALFCKHWFPIVILICLLNHFRW